MKRYILELKEIPEKCSLYEALMWAAFCIFPAGEENVPDDGLYDRYEREDLGLAELIEVNTMNMPREISTLHKMFQDHIKQAGFKNIQEYFKAGEDNPAFLKTYNAAMHDYLSLFQSKIFSLIKEGNLAFWGVPSGSKDRTACEIPATALRQDNIKWFSNRIGNAFCRVSVAFDNLLKEFPEPKAESVRIKHYENTYILERDEDALPKGKGGRPEKIDWTLLYNYCLEHKEAFLTDKQDAFIADFQQYIKNLLNLDISRSAVLERLKKIRLEFSKG